MNTTIRTYSILLQYISITCILLLGIYTHSISECYSQSDLDSNDYHTDHAPVDPLKATLAKKRSEKTVKPPSYNKFRQNFIEVCDQLQIDQRREVFDTILESLIVRNEQCLACKPFFQAFATNCREKKSKQEKKKSKKIIAEDTPETDQEHTANHIEDKPIEKPEIALDPHIFVIDAMSRLGIELAGDEEQKANTLVAVDILGNALSTKVESYIDREYLATAFTYLSAAFDDFRAQQQLKPLTSENSATESEQPSSETLNSLF